MLVGMHVWIVCPDAICVRALPLTRFYLSSIPFPPHPQHNTTQSALGVSNLEELEETAPPAPPPPATPPTSSVLVSVPVGKEQVEFTAGAIGGIIGFSLGGPIVGASGAVAANYIAKKNNDASEVIQTVSKGR